MAVIEAASQTSRPARQRRPRQLGVISPVAALLALVVLAGPMMLRSANVATVPEQATNTSVDITEGVAWPLDTAGQVELGSISPTGILVDGYRDPHLVNLSGECPAASITADMPPRRGA
jgi:hypothetical protein